MPKGETGPPLAPDKLTFLARWLADVRGPSSPATRGPIRVCVSPVSPAVSRQVLRDGLQTSRFAFVLLSVFDERSYSGILSPGACRSDCFASGKYLLTISTTMAAC